MSANKPKSVKITVIGNNSGKHEVINKFISPKAPLKQDLEPDIDEKYTTSLHFKGKDYELEILDTSEEETDQNLMDMWIYFGEGFILIFDINNKETFEEAKKKR